MIRNGFLRELLKKLHVHSAGPFKIITKLNNNPYGIDLSEDFEINLNFNIEDLVKYKGSNFNRSNPLVDEPIPEPFF